MRKLVATLVFLVSLLPTVARADPPIVEPVPDVNVTFPSGDLCAFDLMIETLINEEIMKTFLDDQGNPVRAIITGRLVFRFTNVQTGESVVENISGPVHITYHEDGSETWILGGRSSFPLFPGEPGGPAALLTSGRAILEYGPGGELVEVDISGHVEDLCETLA